MQDITIHNLTANGITSTKILSLLSESDLIDINITPLGQRKLVWEIVKKSSASHDQYAAASSGTTPTIPTMSNPTHQPQRQHEEQPSAIEAISTQLQDLFHAIPSTSNPNTVPESNPLSYLLPPAKIKYHQITKFVHVRGQEEEKEEEVFGDGKRRLILKNTTKTLQVHQVSPMQWCGANVKILMELLREGNLSPISIPDYLAYTAKIADLAEVYQWTSVLEYDDLYRKNQAESGFRWGTEAPHVHRVCLRFKEKSSNANNKEKKSRVCINYQYRKCQRGNSCNYRHICSAPGCGKSHPLAEHDKSKSSSNAQLPGK